MAGYRIGPFDVESVLVTHDQVAEAAVIGVPDQLRGEVIEVFVVLRDPGQDAELAGRTPAAGQGQVRRARLPAPRALRRRPAQNAQRQGPAIHSPPATSRILRAVNPARPPKTGASTHPGSRRTEDHRAHAAPGKPGRQIRGTASNSDRTPARSAHRSDESTQHLLPPGAHDLA